MTIGQLFRERSFMRSHIQRATTKQLVHWSFLLTAVLETITCVLRFGFGLSSTRDTASTIGRLTLGVRIHHGYIGFAMLLVGYAILRRYPVLAKVTLVVGGGLFFSDMIHHFLVMWPITGDPHFHLWYPAFNPSS